MEPELSEFQDWEVLQNSDSDSEEPMIDDSEQSSDFAEGMIQNNYFSLDSHKSLIVSDDSEVSSKASDNPSWIDPVLETQYPRKKLSAESWSDSGSDRFIEFEGKSDVGFVDNDQNDKNLGDFLDDSRGGSSSEGVVECVEGIDELGMEKDGILGGREREGCGEKGESEVRKVEGKRKISDVVWWKLPIELLRYCVFKGPVWTVSVAAAFLGFVILGRRLYKMKMKKKSRALGDRITMDDKKISQFMTRAARLNEAFSVVKRVPMIRPSLPAVGGVTPWPVASLR